MRRRGKGRDAQRRARDGGRELVRPLDVLQKPRLGVMTSHAVRAPRADARVVPGARARGRTDTRGSTVAPNACQEHHGTERGPGAPWHRTRVRSTVARVRSTVARVRSIVRPNAGQERRGTEHVPGAEQHGAHIHIVRPNAGGSMCRGGCVHVSRRVCPCVQAGVSMCPGGCVHVSRHAPRWVVATTTRWLTPPPRAALARRSVAGRSAWKPRDERRRRKRTRKPDGLHESEASRKRR